MTRGKTYFYYFTIILIETESIDKLNKQSILKTGKPIKNKH